MADTNQPAAPAAAAADKPAAKRNVTLNPQRMSLAESWRQDWVVNAEEGTQITDVLDPQYWAHMAQRLAPYDHIEVRLETGEWLLELLVTEVGRNYAQVYVMHKHELSAPAPVPEAIKHKVIWRGPQHKHTVVRISDGAVLQTGFDKAELAREWMMAHERVLAQP